MKLLKKFWRSLKNDKKLTLLAISAFALYLVISIDAKRIANWIAEYKFLEFIFIAIPSILAVLAFQHFYTQRVKKFNSACKIRIRRKSNTLPTFVSASIVALFISNLVLITFCIKVGSLGANYLDANSGFIGNLSMIHSISIVSIFSVFAFGALISIAEYAITKYHNKFASKNAIKPIHIISVVHCVVLASSTIILSFCADKILGSDASWYAGAIIAITSITMASTLIITNRSNIDRESSTRTAIIDSYSFGTTTISAISIFIAVSTLADKQGLLDAIQTKSKIIPQATIGQCFSIGAISTLLVLLAVAAVVLKFIKNRQKWSFTNNYENSFIRDLGSGLSGSITEYTAEDHKTGKDVDFANQYQNIGTL